MNLVENLLNLGVIKIDFDIELERTIFEMKYIIEQKEVIYSFMIFCYNYNNMEKNLFFHITNFPRSKANV